MANLYNHRDSNIRKTWLLMTGFFVLVILLGWVFSYVFNSPNILYFAFGLSLFMNAISYWKSDSIALAMSGARKVSREENPYIHRMVENLCIAAGIKMPGLYVIESDQINAFATGRNQDHAAVAVTTGAISRLENEELEGVLAHELAHIGNRDILLSSVVVVLVGLISILSDFFLRSMFFGSDNDNRSGGVLMIVIAIIAAILAPISAVLIQLAISRKREFMADATGSLITRYPEGLARALEKIEGDVSTMKHAHNATAHLYISNPFKGKQSRNWFAKLFMTHPPVSDRVSALRGLKI